MSGKAVQTTAQKKRRPRRARGDCLAAAFNLARQMDRAGKEVVLVHGHVTGQGTIKGLRFSHAWVEEIIRVPADGEVAGIVVHDASNGRHIMLPWEMYYGIGRIPAQPGTLFRYTYEQAKLRLLESGRYVFWELPLSEDGL